MNRFFLDLTSASLTAIIVILLTFICACFYWLFLFVLNIFEKIFNSCKFKV
jgi:hypothetical protein